MIWGKMIIRRVATVHGFRVQRFRDADTFVLRMISLAK